MPMNRFREPVNGFTHLAGALLAVIGTIWLIAATWQDLAKMIAVAVYGISLIILYSASAMLHLSHGSEQRILQLERFDHAAIYLLIAGTYTPFCYALLTGAWRVGMLVLLWGLALAGVIYKLFIFKQSTRLSTA